MKRALCLLFCIPIACEKKETPAPDPPKPMKEWRLREKGEPDRVEVQFVLISFRGAIPRATDKINRNRDQARKLAEDLFEKAKRGADFLEIWTQFSDDKKRRILGVSNEGIDPIGNEFARLVVAQTRGLDFDKKCFTLKRGELALVPHDPRRNPAGWWLLQRLK